MSTLRLGGSTGDINVPGDLRFKGSNTNVVVFEFRPGRCKRLGKKIRMKVGVLPEHLWLGVLLGIGLNRGDTG